MVDNPIVLQRSSHPSIADNGGQGANKALDKMDRVTDNSVSTPSEVLLDSNLYSSPPTEDEYITRPASYSMRPSSNNTVMSHSSPGVSIDNIERLKQKQDVIVEEKVIGDTNGMSENYSYPEEEQFFPWTRVGSFSETGKGVPITANTKMVRAYLTEHIYTDWYNNTSAVVGTCFFSWLIAYLGFCWLSLPAVFFCTASVYRAESRRFERNVRDDLKRTAVAETLENKYETTVWLNTFLAKFWVIYMPVLSEQVKSAVNPQLAGTAPGYGIDALSLEEFTLGSKAPSVQSIKSYPKKGEDVVEMDWKFSFTPSDVSDMTAKEAKSKVNPKISLGVTLGKSFVSKTLPVLVEDINVAGNVRVTMTFSNSFPNIKTVSISLLEPPLIDFALKPVGGDTLGIDIMSFLPGLKTVVKSLIDSNAKPMLYAPNHLDFDVEEIMKAQSQDVIGVVAVTLHSAQGLKFMGSANPLISLETENTVDGVEPVVKSQVKYNSKSPKWNETKYVLVSSLQQKLFLKCLHSHDYRKDSLIGECEYDLSELYQNPSQHGLELELESSRKSRGVLRFDLAWYPVVGKEEEKKDDNASASASDDASAELDEDGKSTSDVGVFKFILHKIKYLSTATTLTGSLSPSAELYIDGKKCKNYRTLRRMNEPSWEETLEILVPSKVESEFALKVYDERISGKELICEYTAPVCDVVSASENGDEFLRGSPQGEIYFGSEWKPVAIPESVISSKQAMRDPLGAVRLHVRDAAILESLEGVGDIDAYFVVSRDRTVVYKSNYFSKNTKPVFNNVIYIPIVSERQTVFIDLYDFQKIGKDRYIGGCHFKIDNLIERDPNSGKLLPVGSDNKVLRWKLCDKSKRLTNNVIRSSLTFVPTIPVYGPHEIEKVQELERRISEKQKEFEVTQEKLRKEMEKHPEDYEIVEVDVEDKDALQLGQKQKMGLDELVAVNSGVMNVRISKGKLTKVNGYLQVLCDEIPYPVSISSKAEDGLLSAERAEYFVRDLQNSLTTFRVVGKPIVKGPGDIISEETFNTLELLKKCYSQPTTINVRGSTIDLQMMYSPSSVKLPPSETVIDTGLLDLEINSAENVPAHDRNGLSDPYVVVKVDGESLFTTEVVRKTLSPTWNAKTRVPIPSRARSSLILEVYDWDRSGSNTLLSKASFPLPSLGVDTSQIFSLDLEPQGRMKIRTRFEPQYIRPAVNVSEGSFVAMPLKAVGTVANFGIGMAGAGVGAAAGAAANVADFGIGGIQKGGRLLKGIGGFATNKSQSKADEPAKKLGPNPFDEAPNAVPNNSYATVEKQRGSISASQDPSTELNSIAGPPGIITQGFSHTRSNSLVRNIAPNSIHPCTLTILAAEQLGKSVQIRVSLAKGGRMKHIYRTEKQKADENGSCHFNETCEFKAPPEANLIFGAVAHHTFSKDTNLGLTQVNLGDPQLQQEGQILIKLGRGHIIFKIDYGDAATPPVPTIPTIPTIQDRQEHA